MNPQRNRHRRFLEMNLPSPVSPRLLYPPLRRNPLTFNRLANLMDDPDVYDRMLANLLGRSDLLLQMAMMAHIRATIGNLNDEMRRQWDMAQNLYGTMERNGLEEELGDAVTQTPSRSPLSDPLPPYQRTPPVVPTVRRRPTPSTSIVFPDVPSRPPTPQRSQPARRATSHRFNPIGTRTNPILVEEDSDDDPVETFCHICRGWGHLWIDCANYQCEHCQTYGPGHTLSDCFYR
jgi:hypothetical protein